jgi:hypothetical protein
MVRCARRDCRRISVTSSGTGTTLSASTAATRVTAVESRIAEEQLFGFDSSRADGSGMTLNMLALRDCDAVTDAEPAHRIADGHDCAGDFMTRHGGK